MALFNYFDTDGSGFLTPDNLREAFAKTGKTLTDAQLYLILEKHEKNGAISLDEFKRMFQLEHLPVVRKKPFPKPSAIDVLADIKQASKINLSISDDGLEEE
jgi:EF-hand domain pair